MVLHFTKTSNYTTKLIEQANSDNIWRPHNIGYKTWRSNSIIQTFLVLTSVISILKVIRTQSATSYTLHRCAQARADSVYFNFSKRKRQKSEDILQ